MQWPPHGARMLGGPRRGLNKDRGLLRRGGEPCGVMLGVTEME